MPAHIRLTTAPSASPSCFANAHANAVTNTDANAAPVANTGSPDAHTYADADTVGVAVRGYVAAPRSETVLFNLLAGFLGIERREAAHVEVHRGKIARRRPDSVQLHPSACIERAGQFEVARAAGAYLGGQARHLGDAIADDNTSAGLGLKFSAGRPCRRPATRHYHDSITLTQATLSATRD